MAYFILGQVRRRQGNLTEARSLLAKAMELFALIDDLVGLESVSVAMGFLETAAGNISVAKALFLKLLQVTQREHSPKTVLAAFIGLATSRAHEGDALTALTWILSVLQLSTLDWGTRIFARELQTELESQLTPDQIATAQAQAMQQSLADIMAEAINKSAATV